VLTAALLALGLTGPAFCTDHSIAPADSLDRLYDRGRSYPEFLDATKARRETWLDNTRDATVEAALLARARAIPGPYRLLVVAEDWCGDSANTIPYIARLVDSLPQLSLRIVNSRDGRFVMERYRTPDGRAATPTVVLLDGAGEPVGCFVERPAALREALTNRNKPREDIIAEWRRADSGRSTVGEIVTMLEAAAAGTGRCVTGS
jgi:hypothetical protein